MTRNDIMFWIGLANLGLGVYRGDLFGSALGGLIVLWAYYCAPSQAAPSQGVDLKGST